MESTEITPDNQSPVVKDQNSSTARKENAKYIYIKPWMWFTLIFIMIALMGALFFWGNNIFGISGKEASDKVDSLLETKYNNDFTIVGYNRIQSTTDNGSWNIIFHPTNNSDVRSHATVSKDGREIKDYYTGTLVSVNFAEDIKKDVEKLVGFPVTVRASVGFKDGSLAEKGGRNMSLAEFIKQNPKAYFYIGVLVGNVGESDTKILLSKTASLVASSIPNGRVYLANVDEPTYSGMISSQETSELQDIENKADYWVNITNSLVGIPSN